MEEPTEEEITIAQAQAHRDLAEADKFQFEARVAVLRELRSWLTTHRIEDDAGIKELQPLTPLIERDSPAFETIKNKAIDIIEAL